MGCILDGTAAESAAESTCKSGRENQQGDRRGGQTPSGKPVKGRPNRQGPRLKREGPQRVEHAPRQVGAAHLQHMVTWLHGYNQKFCGKYMQPQEQDYDLEYRAIYSLLTPMRRWVEIKMTSLGTVVDAI